MTEKPLTGLGRRFAERRRIINRKLTFVDESQFPGDTLDASSPSVLDDDASRRPESKFLDVGIRRQSEQFVKRVIQSPSARTSTFAKL